MENASGAEQAEVASQAKLGNAVPAHFILRRLHSLSGVVPLGVYFVVHLFIGATAISGGEVYNSVQAFINRIPLLTLFEIIVIIIPLGFHAIYGITIAIRDRSNPFTYPYIDNWRYALQRLTGLYLLVFLAVHLYFIWVQVRFTGAGSEAFGESPFGFVSDLLRNHSFMVIYTLGVWAAAFHLANGIWTFCITWGIAVDERKRRVIGWAACLLFIILAYFGFRTVQAFYAGHPTWPLPSG